MKKFFYLTVFAIFLNGCSSPATNTETKINSNAPANVAVVNKTQTANAEVTQAANTETNANEVHIRGMMINKNSRDEMYAGKGKSDIPPEPIIPTAVATPHSAPDNSEITSAMDSKGQVIETRTFKNNPVLAKMEANMTDIKNPLIKIYLKNGKVVNAPSGKISNPSEATVNEILSATGLAPKAAPKN